MTKIPNVSILGVKIASIRKSEALLELKKIVQGEKHKIITTSNTEFVMLAYKNEEFRNLLNNRSRLNLPDGIGLIWASKFLSIKGAGGFFAYPVILIRWILSILFVPWLTRMKTPIPDKISGSDLIWDIARMAAEHNWRIFLAGGAPTVAERAALKLQTDIENLKIAGVFSGDAEDSDNLIQIINKAKADILILCFGTPKQEFWLQRNILRTDCKFGIGLGGTFDFLAGVKKRAPIWVQRFGFEWLYRLISEPGRIRRQMSIPKLMILALVYKLRNK